MSALKAIYIHEPLHRRAKLAAIFQGKSLVQLVEDALTELLEKQVAARAEQDTAGTYRALAPEYLRLAEASAHYAAEVIMAKDANNWEPSPEEIAAWEEAGYEVSHVR